MKPPVIGVTRCSRLDDYIASIDQTGARVRILEVAESPRAVLALVDGVLLTGGGDVDPAFYGADRHETVQDAEPGRDEFEIDLARRALEADVPLLAICRGAQVLNVALGGSLHMHLPDDAGGRVEHRRPGSEGPAASHEIRVARDSVLGHALGADRVTVNSYHHQAVRKLGRGLRAVAHADDGVIEAVESTGPDFVVGVQWHAECMDAREQRALFEAFVEASRCASERGDEEPLAA